MDTNNFEKPKSMKLEDILNQLPNLYESCDIVITKGYLQHQDDEKYGVISILYSNQKKEGPAIMVVKSYKNPTDFKGGRLKVSVAVGKENDIYKLELFDVHEKD